MAEACASSALFRRREELPLWHNAGRSHRLTVVALNVILENEYEVGNAEAPSQELNDLKLPENINIVQEKAPL